MQEKNAPEHMEKRGSLWDLAHLVEKMWTWRTSIPDLSTKKQQNLVIELGGSLIRCQKLNF